MSEKELLSVVETATRFRIYLASQKIKIIVDHRSLTFMDHLKSPTSPRLQRWAMFMSQFSYEIVYKKGRLHSNADGLSRMTYEPTEVPTPAVTDALMDDNFGNAVDLGMRESDFNPLDAGSRLTDFAQSSNAAGSLLTDCTVYERSG